MPALGAPEGPPARAGAMLVLNNALPAPQMSAVPANPAPATPPVQESSAANVVPSADAGNPAGTAAVLRTDGNVSPTDLWQRIRNGFAMSELDSPLIARHEQWYSNRPDYMARMTERSQRYLYFIVEEVEKRGMPTEIALLPMIESAFNPEAYSIAHASGIWQFMPYTGKKYGLQQNWWYDGRRDIVGATNSALDYLQQLHDMFGDWELALAAYNWGEGAVQRAQERNRKRGLPVDYASLKMPEETRNYIPKLLAIKNIVSNPGKFGLALQPISNKPYFASVTTKHHIDVKLAAQLAEISMDEFSALNPAHNRPVILQENNDVLLPVEKINTFLTNLASYGDSLVSWQAYQSKKGERLDQVAPRFGLSVAKLKSINGLPTRTTVSDGQALLVPLNGEDADSEFEPFNTHLAPASRSSGSAHTHVVRKGETLNSLSRHYRVTVAQLRNWNGNIKQVKRGQSILIVQASKPRPAVTSVNPRVTAKSGKTRVTVQSGKTRVAAKTSKPRHLAHSGKSRTHVARAAAKSHKRLARKAQRPVHVAYNR